MKAGRNDPCPCGSGKKYKKCCLRKDEAQTASSRPARRTAEASVDSLRAKIMGFVEKRGLMDNSPAAMSLYWKTLDDGLEPRPMTHNDTAGFTEWFIHDYVLPDYGKPPISVFLESNPNLTREERQILEDCQKTNISVHQITRVEQNHGVYAEDIFTGEHFFLHDISISRSVKQWQLLVSRRVWVLDEWQLSAVGTTLPPTEKEEIYDFVMNHYRSYAKRNSEETPLLQGRKGIAVQSGRRVNLPCPRVPSNVDSVCARFCELSRAKVPDFFEPADASSI